MNILVVLKKCVPLIIVTLHKKKRRMLSQNFSRINQEVDDMIKHIQTECKKESKTNKK